MEDALKSESLLIEESGTNGRFEVEDLPLIYQYTGRLEKLLQFASLVLLRTERNVADPKLVKTFTSASLKDLDELEEIIIKLKARVSTKK